MGYKVDLMLTFDESGNLMRIAQYVLQVEDLPENIRNAFDKFTEDLRAKL